MDLSKLQNKASQVFNADLGRKIGLGDKNSPEVRMKKNRVTGPDILAYPNQFFYIQFDFVKYSSSLLLELATDKENLPQLERLPENTGNSWQDMENKARNAGTSLWGGAKRDTKENLQKIREERRANTLAKIQLPLPRNLTERYDVQYNQGDINVLMKVLADLGIEIADAIQPGDNFFASISKAFNATVKSTPDIAEKSTAILTQGLVDIFGGTAGRNLRGKITNPIYVASFGGVSLRQHEFQWTIIPESQEEAGILFGIRDKIREHTLPAFTNPGDISLLNFPELCYVSMYPQLYPTPKACFVTSFSVDYTSDGVPTFHHDNTALSYNISMTLMEATALSREDIENKGETRE